jgi:hypothetical protein
VLAAVDAIFGTEALTRYTDQGKNLAAESLSDDPLAAEIIRRVKDTFEDTAAKLLKLSRASHTTTGSPSPPERERADGSQAAELRERLLRRLRRPLGGRCQHGRGTADRQAGAPQGVRGHGGGGPGKLDELLWEKKRTGTVAPRDTRVEKIVRDRLENEPQSVRSPITRRVHAGHAERIIAALGKVKLVQLTPSQVERFLRKMADDGYSIKTIRDTRSLLAGAIRRA